MIVKVILDLLKIERFEIPAVTHVDYSARLQTVSKQTNHFYHSLISDFYSLSKYPVIINTSFNVRGEPIVCSFRRCIYLFYANRN